jgi:hypothetical protein
MHVTSERFQPCSFRTKTTSLAVVTPSVAQVLCAALGLCIFIPLEFLMVCQGF